MSHQLCRMSLGEIDGHKLALEIAGPSAIRLRVASSDDFAPYPSHAIVQTDWPEQKIEESRPSSTTLIIKTEKLLIEWDSKSFRLTISERESGTVLLATPPNAFAIGDDGITVVIGASPRERIYGFGEGGEKFEKTGRAMSLWNHDEPHRHPLQNLYCQIPLTYHLAADGSRCRGQFLDNPGRVHVDLRHDMTGNVSLRCETSDLDLWLWFGDSLRDVVRTWTDMTGRMERPPLWALGYHQCRWSYPTETRVREIAEGFRSRKIPCDVIYLDIDYMIGYRVFTWDPVKFNQPEKMLSDLSDDGFHVVAIVDPGVKVDPTFQVYRDFLARDGFFLRREGADEPYTGIVWPGETHFPDFLREDVRKHWGAFQAVALLEKGVAGIWNDMNEPASVSEPTKTVPDDVLQNDHGYIRQHCEVHQLYGLSMAQASYEGQITARPETRPFTITRSAWAGVQRYAMVWTGDNEALWSNMHYDIGLNLAMGLCGISFVGCDIGGFGHNPTSELYGRWFEWGVLQPFCRGHAAHGSIDQEPWAFTPEVEANVKRLLELRMSLLPFLYTCFVHSAESGDPINRPLVYEYPRDPNTHFVGDSFLLGSDILVAPVLEPGMDRRMVYLPEGEWWNWWTGEKLAGARHILAEAPFGQPPLFVRAGAIIPMQESMEYTGQRAVEETILDVWPGATLAGQLVEDDGASRSWQNGEEVRFEFSGSVESGALILRIGSPQGPYRSQRKTWRIRLHGLASKVRRVAVAQKDVETKTVDGVVEWTIPDTGNSIEMNVQLAD